MSNSNDFVIENGVLEKYTGVSEKVIVPEGVIEIGAHAFHECTHVKQVIFPSSTFISVSNTSWSNLRASEFVSPTFKVIVFSLFIVSSTILNSSKLTLPLLVTETV